MQDFIRKIDFFRSDGGDLISPQFVVMAVCFGLIISFIVVYYQRRVIGSLIRASRYADAIDEESAKTLAEISQENNISAITKLKKSTSLQGLVTVCNATTDTKGKMKY